MQGITDAMGPIGTGPSAQRTTGKDTLGKEDFLRLLTTQLSNQDPLNPMDNTAFVSQMAEFSGLEQMMNMSASVEQLAVAQAIGNGTDMVSFIGKEVAYMGDTVSYEPPGAESVGVDLAGKASKVTVSVYDEQGNLVKTIEQEGSFDEGMNEITWDGTDTNGTQVPEGEYTFKVSAEDAEGDRVEASMRLTGVVTGVTYTAGYPELIIDGRNVPVGQVMEVMGRGESAGSGGGSDTEGAEGEPFVTTQTGTEYRPAR
jgi:flagellar basal-body rod modification protein FlgD